MILAINENGEFEEYKESYASVDFKTEEDYKRFEEILKYYSNREEHERQIRAKAIEDYHRLIAEEIKNDPTNPYLLHLYNFNNYIKECLTKR